ncbi:hypothetical protein [Cyclobacterium amurskyense]|jgi:hypothetical protein|uniref:hypothetical protein n=1 Tax=Cyclobacterium amurskyense TaxID=320787 RepID=UPI0030DB47D1|tara:strand:+ start:5121 stop:5366 length:246 start_codon:yes stop_codon:yes gene_type:complete
MKSKLLFLPDILLLLFICIACERHEFRHKEFGTTGETVLSTLITDRRILEKEKEYNEQIWDIVKDNVNEHFIGFIPEMIED